MTLHLASLDLIEEPPVVTTGERVGDRQPPDLFIRARELAIREADSRMYGDKVSDSGAQRLG
jgi:hypothetical protein